MKYLILIFFSINGFAQVLFEGVVKSANTKESLAGAAIYIPNSTYGTYSDENGKFSIQLPLSTKEIVISFIGYHPINAQLNISDGKNINKTIQDISQLDNYEFLDLFYLNKLNDKKYVKKVFENKISNPFGSINDGFVNNIEGNSRYYVELNQKLPENAPADFKQKPKYYKLIGYDAQGRGVYKRIEEITNKLNDRNLITYSDYVELNNSEINKLESLVEFDRKMNEVLVKPEIIEEEFDLNSLDYGGNEIFPELSQEEFNKLTEEERATIEWQKKNCK